MILGQIRFAQQHSIQDRLIQFTWGSGSGGPTGRGRRAQPGTCLSPILRSNVLHAQESQRSKSWLGLRSQPGQEGPRCTAVSDPQEPTQLSGSTKARGKRVIISRRIVHWGRKEEKDKTTFSTRFHLQVAPPFASLKKAHSYLQSPILDKAKGSGRC